MVGPIGKHYQENNKGGERVGNSETFRTYEDVIIHMQELKPE